MLRSFAMLKSATHIRMKSPAGACLSVVMLCTCSCTAFNPRMLSEQSRNSKSNMIVRTQNGAEHSLADASGYQTRQETYQQSAPPKPVSDFTPADERVPLSNRDTDGAAAQAQLARDFPDEYLFDGGDRKLPIHYDDFAMLGLDSEDAIAEYYDDEGKRHVRPSSRVAVYAPRFGAVTTVSGPTEGVVVNRASETQMEQRGSGLRGREAAIDQEQRESTQRMVTRSRSSSLLTQLAQTEALQSLAVEGHNNTQGFLQTYTFLKSGEFLRTEEAQLSSSIQSAGVWTRELYPVIAATEVSAGALSGRFNAAEYAGLEQKFVKPGRLRIIKLADKTVAEPGDIITFSIRYDNLGDREVRDVVIIDNLTPRLEYVDDSATSNHDGRLVTQDNGEGSLILRWEFDQPVAGRKGGVVTFQARVR